MAVYEYRGFDKGGKAVNGIIDADTAKLARARLRKMGLFPTDVTEQAKGGGATRGTGLNVEIDFSKYFQFVTARDISLMTRQMAVMLGASIPMAETLHALVEQTEKPQLKIVLSEVKQRVNEGSTLADALKQHPSMFNELFIHMVRAGERAGSLAPVLVRLADFSESQVKLRGQIIAAMVYPILMSIVGMVILMIVFLVAVPQMREVIDGVLGGNVPLITKMVFFMGDMLTSLWCWCCFLPIGIGITIGMVYWARGPGKRTWDIIRLKIPMAGKLSRMVAVARFCRTLGTLLLSGVPILAALGIVKEVVGNEILKEAVEAAATNIQEGQSIAVPLKQSGQFPPLVTHMIAIGEKTGELENMLETVADAYESQVATALESFTALLGPIMIIAMGGVVFFVALGLLWPLSQLASAMQQSL